VAVETSEKVAAPRLHRPVSISGASLSRFDMGKPVRNHASAAETVFYLIRDIDQVAASVPRPARR